MVNNVDVDLSSGNYESQIKIHSKEEMTIRAQKLFALFTNTPVITELLQKSSYRNDDVYSIINRCLENVSGDDDKEGKINVIGSCENGDYKVITYRLSNLSSQMGKDSYKMYMSLVEFPEEGSNLGSTFAALSYEEEGENSSILVFLPSKEGNSGGPHITLNYNESTDEISYSYDSEKQITENSITIWPRRETWEGSAHPVVLEQ